MYFGYCYVLFLVLGHMLTQVGVCVELGGLGCFSPFFLFTGEFFFYDCLLYLSIYVLLLTYVLTCWCTMLSVFLLVCANELPENGMLLLCPMPTPLPD